MIEMRGALGVTRHSPGAGEEPIIDSSRDNLRLSKSSHELEES